MGDTTRRPLSTPEYGPRFWIAFALGSVLIAFGVIGLVGDLGARGAADVAAWLAGANIVEDLALAPLACLVGALVARVLPEPWRAPVRAALLATGVVVLVAFPALRGYGRDHVPDNLSVDPLNYATATATVLAVVWAVAAAWTVARILRCPSCRRSCGRRSDLAPARRRR
jgi:hypothetical protein